MFVDMDADVAEPLELTVSDRKILTRKERYGNYCRNCRSLFVEGRTCWEVAYVETMKDDKDGGYVTMFTLMHVCESCFDKLYRDGVKDEFFWVNCMKYEGKL